MAVGAESCYKISQVLSQSCNS